MSDEPHDEAWFSKQQREIDDLAKLALMLIVGVPFVFLLGLLLTFVFVNHW